MPTKCQHPDCDAPLGRGNNTGLCREHNHTPGLCGCLQCSGITKRNPGLHRVRQRRDSSVAIIDHNIHPIFVAPEATPQAPGGHTLHGVRIPDEEDYPLEDLLRPVSARTPPRRASWHSISVSGLR